MIERRPKELTHQKSNYLIKEDISNVEKEMKGLKVLLIFWLEFIYKPKILIAILKFLTMRILSKGILFFKEFK